MGFCKDCQFWQEAFKRGSLRFGTCDHPLVPDKVLMDKDDESDADEKVIHTDGYFGCVYFTPEHGNVVTKINIKE